MRILHMRTSIVVLLLLCGLSQQAQRTFNFGVSTGFSQFYSASSHSTDTYFLNPQANPILSGPFRYISADAQLGLTTAFGISLGIGYNELIGSFGGTNDRQIPRTYYQPLYKSVFLEPGVIYMYELDERLHLISSLSSSIHLNISKNFSPEMQLLSSNYEVISDFQRKDAAAAYLTINPSVEIRSVATTNIRIGFLVKYFQGLGTMMNYGGAFYNPVNDVSESYAASYKGSGILLALRVSYCLACSN